MKNLSEYIIESMEEEIEESNEDMKYCVVDVDLDEAIMSVWDTEDDAKAEIASQLEKNNGLNLKVNPVKASEVEKD